MIIAFKLVTENKTVLEIATNADYDTSDEVLFVEIAPGQVLEIPRSKYDELLISYEARQPSLGFAVSIIESAKKGIVNVLEGRFDQRSMSLLQYDLVFILVAISKGLLPKVPLIRH